MFLQVLALIIFWITLIAIPVVFALTVRTEWDLILSGIFVVWFLLWTFAIYQLTINPVG